MRRLLPRLLIATLLLMCSALVMPTRAFAAADSYDSYDVVYAVDASGNLRVRETWVLRFGSSSGRHGFDRYLVTREAYDDQQDQLYEISGVSVTSPDAISTDVSRSTTSEEDGRLESTRIRIGSASQTITADTATYVISYSVRGALRTGAGNLPELYWDATGSGMGTISHATVSVTVPDTVVGTRCYSGPPRSTTACTSSRSEGATASFTQDRIPSGSLLTIATQMPAGAVADAAPLLVERADAGNARVAALVTGASVAGTVGVPLLGWLWYRRRGHDERFEGVPPGTVPLTGQPSRVVRNDPRIQIPVAFSPPKLPVAYAGFLVDGRYGVEHLTATVVGLATSGAIRLDSQYGATATLVNADRAQDAPSKLVLADLFARGASIDLGAASQLVDTSQRLAEQEESVAMSNGWFRRLVRGRKTAGGLSFAWVGALVMFGWLGAPLLAFAMVLLPVTVAAVVTLIVVRMKMAKGQRTAVGRAWTDQVEGFRLYLTTAEADQLRFEEGEDIFSKYLPWAVLFGEADRWVRVCEQAIELGRIPMPSGAWYGAGGWNPTLMMMNLNALSTSV
ncbi:MAG: DUF2207 domain-containing protein, partial [Propioniciclava sp.]